MTPFPDLTKSKIMDIITSFPISSIETNGSSRIYQSRFKDTTAEKYSNFLAPSESMPIFLSIKLCMLSLEYSNKVLAFPQSTNYLYDILLAKIVNQVACFKLRNNEYNANYLSELIHTLSLLRLDDVHKQIISFIKKHGVDLQNIDSY